MGGEESTIRRYCTSLSPHISPSLYLQRVLYIADSSFSCSCSRFLRARKFDIPGAVKQYTDFLAWRDDKGVDEAYENYDVEEFETLRRLYPMFVGRRDLVRPIP